ncbi:hypothetical protein FKM82_021186 [Ascaphus truei]
MQEHKHVDYTLLLSGKSPTYDHPPPSFAPIHFNGITLLYTSVAHIHLIEITHLLPHSLNRLTLSNISTSCLH